MEIIKQYSIQQLNQLNRKKREIERNTNRTEIIKQYSTQQLNQLNGKKRNKQNGDKKTIFHAAIKSIKWKEKKERQIEWR